MLEAALLFTLLSNCLPSPTEVWKDIMDRSLRKQRELMEGSAQWMRTGREFLQVWKDHENEQPLLAVLRLGVPLVFPSSAAGQSAQFTELESESIARKMSPDATPMVWGVKDIVGEL